MVARLEFEGGKERHYTHLKTPDSRSGDTSGMYVEPRADSGDGTGGHAHEVSTKKVFGRCMSRWASIRRMTHSLPVLQTGHIRSMARASVPLSI
jgi:hypothetical protein